MKIVPINNRLMKEHEHVLKAAREVLERAKKKEFNGLAVIATHIDGSVTTFTSESYGNRIAMLAGLHLLSWRIIEERAKK